MTRTVQHCTLPPQSPPYTTSCRPAHTQAHPGRTSPPTTIVPPFPRRHKQTLQRCIGSPTNCPATRADITTWSLAGFWPRAFLLAVVHPSLGERNTQYFFGIVFPPFQLKQQLICARHRQSFWRREMTPISLATYPRGLLQG